MDKAKRRVETPSPRLVDAPPKTKEGSEGSSQPALSTPTAEEVTLVADAEPSPKSGFELASPSQLPQTLAETRQRDLEETHVSFADAAGPSGLGPASPVFLPPEEPLEPMTPAETPLRLEPAPCAQGSEVRTVAQSRNEEPQPETPASREPASPPRRSLVPALAISWAEMEVAALDTPKCSEAISPSYPSEPVDGTVSPGQASSPVHDAVRVESRRPVYEAAAPQWEPIAMPLRQRSPSPVYCALAAKCPGIQRPSPQLPRRPSPLHWGPSPCQVPRALCSPIVVMPRPAQTSLLRQIQVASPATKPVAAVAVAAPVAAVAAAPAAVPSQTAQPESQQSSNRSTPLSGAL